MQNLSGEHQGLLWPGQGMVVRLLGWDGSLWGALTATDEAYSESTGSRQL